MTRKRFVRRGALLIGTAILFTLQMTPGPAAAQRSWAPASTATLHPGVMTVTGGNQCSANFVFYDKTWTYLGQAAHCAGTGDSTVTDGCLAPTLPMGTQVIVQGASRPATMVYSSWVTMQKRNETDADLCAYNDFALLRLSKEDAGRINPSVPFWGGPTGLATGSRFGAAVYGYGNSGLWSGLAPLQPHRGVIVQELGGGRGHKVYTVTPGIPGDSGSAYLDSTGKALGVLSTIEIIPIAASNNVADLRAALIYMRQHSPLRVTLALGTERFSP